MKRLNWLMMVFLSCCQLAVGQTFDSGSDGSDGALSFTTPGTFDFDPGALGLDGDGDHIFHFTTITIGLNVTLRISAAQINGPVYWLASGDVTIDGILDLNGAPGQDGEGVLNEAYRSPALPGAGGFPGGLGGMRTSAATRGSGPGGGSVTSGRGGGGAGHVTASNGAAYGNIYSVPLIGGSGGGGGWLQGSLAGGSGGAGGGCILIASSTSITINGTVQVNGGDGGDSQGNSSSYPDGGGSGSGGAIRLASPMLSGSGSLLGLGGIRGAGYYNGGTGSSGRIRLEAFQYGFTGTITPTPSYATPYATHLPSNPPAMVRVTSVDGVAVSASPSGSFTMPDAVINNGTPLTIDIEAGQVPLGTVVQVYLLSENTADQIIDSTPLAGTLDSSMATATALIPSGFSRGYVRASWNP